MIPKHTAYDRELRGVTGCEGVSVTQLSLFRALRGIAPHLEASGVLEACEAARVVVFVWEPGGTLLHAGRFVRDALELGADDPADAIEYGGENGQPLAPGEHPAEQVRRNGHPLSNVTLRARVRDREIWVQMSFSALALGEGGGYSVLGIGSDVTAQKRAKDELRRLATRDHLTGLLNRGEIRTRAIAEARRSTRLGAPMSVAMVDVDHFKRVNDGFGHAAGDEALRHVALLLGRHMRSYDMVGRWGGEEFLLLLPQASAAAGMRIAERVRAAFGEDPFLLVDGTPYPLTVSIGVATLDHESLAFEELLERADGALYEAKAAGRDRVVAARAPVAAGGERRAS